MTSHDIQSKISKAMGWWSPDGFDAYPEKTAKVLALFTTELTKAENQAYANVEQMIDKRNSAEGNTISAAQLRRWLRKLQALSAGDGEG